jgi:hypothetical protein
MQWGVLWLCKFGLDSGPVSSLKVVRVPVQTLCSVFVKELKGAV